MEAFSPVASVIVSTRDRAGSLRIALQSILHDGSSTPAEIIVVDNGTSDETAAVVDSLAAEARLPLILVKEPTAGLAVARNTGVARSRGQYVLFTDDDVEVRPGWIDSIVKSFAPGVGAVGGRITPHFLGEAPEWLQGYPAPMTLVDYGEARFDMGPGRLPIGANMAFDGALLRRLLPQPFDPRLGHNGRVGLGGEETFLLDSVSLEHRIVYCPEAHVLHRVEARRCAYPSVRKSFYQLGFGTARMRIMANEPQPGLLRRLVRTLRCARGAVTLAVRNGRCEELDRDAAQAEFWAFLWLGFHIEMLFGRFPAVSEWLARCMPQRGNARVSCT